MKIEFEVTTTQLQEIVNALNSRYILNSYPADSLGTICRDWLQGKKDEEEKKKEL